MTTEDLKEIAAQLKTPAGENGIAIGKSMNEKNIGMTMSAIEALSITKNQYVLELGHGNGGHVKHILDKAPNVRYVGLEVSEEMKKQAVTMNRLYLPHDLVSFHLYNGSKITFEDEIFDHILTVNTLYFWEKPSTLLAEIYRILKPNGTCCITFADRSFMEELPFTKYGFNLYNIEDFKKLIENSGFKILHLNKKRDRVLSKTGEEVVRKYYTTILGK